MPAEPGRDRRFRHPLSLRLRTRTVAVLLCAGLAAGIAGCGSSSSSTESSASSGSSAGAAATSTSASTTSASTAASVVNCGVKVHVAKPPTRAISLNQGATELMLTLGLQKSMIGTAYLDDSVLPSLKKAYDSVPVLSKEYPSAEDFLAKQPDFAIASYASAFSPKEGVGSRSSLDKLGIATYLLPDGCANADENVGWTFADDFSEIRQVGTLFGVSSKARRVIARQKAQLKQALGSGPLPGKGVRILWWDSEDKSPFIGACCGGPGLIMKTVGATNVFDHVKGNWQNVDWEAAIAKDPQVIVLVNAGWDTLQSKLKYIASNPALQALPAVKHKRFVVIPFSDSTPGVRNVEAVRALAAGLRKLHLNG
jgi:iron complex transport system substrate-binding protein